MNIKPPSLQKPKLLDQVRAATRIRNMSPRTQRVYVSWIRRFILFHHKRHPKDMGAREVEQFLSALAVDANLAAASQNQALAALLFLYRNVLHQDLPWLSNMTRAKTPKRLPIVLSRREVRAVLHQLKDPLKLMATLLYGAGLRLLECARLRIKDIDLGVWCETPRREVNEGRAAVQWRGAEGDDYVVSLR